MTTNYPTGLDSFAAPGGTLAGPPDHEDMHTDVQDAVEAIQAELGLSPSGSSSTVTARLDAIDNTAYATWAPTVTQSGGVTVTVSDAKKRKIGKIMHFEAYLIVTGTGTGGNDVVISLPEASAARYTVNHVLGVGFIYDASATLRHKGIVGWATSTSIKLHPTAGSADGYLGSSIFTAGLAVGDLVSVQGTYETLA